MQPPDKRIMEFSPISEDRGTSPRFQPVPTGMPVPSQILASRTLAAREGRSSPVRKSDPTVSSPSSPSDESSSSDDDEHITESQMVAQQKADKSALRVELRQRIADVTKDLIKESKQEEDVVYVKEEHVSVQKPEAPAEVGEKPKEEPREERQPEAPHDAPLEPEPEPAPKDKVHPEPLTEIAEERVDDQPAKAPEEEEKEANDNDKQGKAPTVGKRRDHVLLRSDIGEVYGAGEHEEEIQISQVTIKTMGGASKAGGSQPQPQAPAEKKEEDDKQKLPAKKPSAGKRNSILAKFPQADEKIRPTKLRFSESGNRKPEEKGSKSKAEAKAKESKGKEKGKDEEKKDEKKKEKPKSKAKEKEKENEKEKEPKEKQREKQKEKSEEKPQKKKSSKEPEKKGKASEEREKKKLDKKSESPKKKPSSGTHRDKKTAEEFKQYIVELSNEELDVTAEQQKIVDLMAISYKRHKGNRALILDRELEHLKSIPMKYKEVILEEGAQSEDLDTCPHLGEKVQELSEGGLVWKQVDIAAMKAEKRSQRMAKREKRRSSQANTVSVSGTEGEERKVGDRNISKRPPISSIDGGRVRMIYHGENGPLNVFVFEILKGGEFSQEVGNENMV